MVFFQENMSLLYSLLHQTRHTVLKPFLDSIDPAFHTLDWDQSVRDCLYSVRQVIAHLCEDGRRNVYNQLYAVQRLCSHTFQQTLLCYFVEHSAFSALQSTWERACWLLTHEQGYAKTLLSQSTITELRGNRNWRYFQATPKSIECNDKQLDAFVHELKKRLRLPKGLQVVDCYQESGSINADFLLSIAQFKPIDMVIVNDVDQGMRVEQRQSPADIITLVYSSYTGVIEVNSQDEGIATAWVHAFAAVFLDEHYVPHYGFNLKPLLNISELKPLLPASVASLQVVQLEVDDKEWNARFEVAMHIEESAPKDLKRYIEKRWSLSSTYIDDAFVPLKATVALHFCTPRSPLVVSFSHPNQSNIRYHCPHDRLLATDLFKRLSVLEYQ